MFTEDRLYVTLTVVMLLTVVILSLLAWVWGIYLDKVDRDPGPVRYTMFLILLLVGSVEVGCAVCGLTNPWVAKVSILVNVWGGLDAILRFQAAHELESFFAAKQFTLQVTKTVAFIGGIRGFRQNVCKFTMLLLLDVWGMPVLYLMALPVHAATSRDDASDVDLILRVWQLATSWKERHKFWTRCQTWWLSKIGTVTEKSPLMARYAMYAAASPIQRRRLQRCAQTV